MMKRCVLFMSICLASSQLVGMQKPCINTAGELKTLALAVEPEDYNKILKKYRVEPSAVSQSIYDFMKSNHLPDDIRTHVETTAEYNDNMYRQQIVQIMYEYRLRSTAQISFSDQIKTEIFAEVNRQLSEENSKIDELEIRSRDFLGSFLGGLIAAIPLGLGDIVTPFLFLARKC